MICNIIKSNKSTPHSHNFEVKVNFIFLISDIFCGMTVNLQPLRKQKIDDNVFLNPSLSVFWN